jgi:phosphate transport system substrate-binding protein
LLTLSVTLAGCNGSGTESQSGADAGEYEVNRELEGKIQVDGSSTVYPISEAAAAQFAERYPNVTISVGSSGSGAGFRRFVRGEIDISDASRPIKPEEFARAVENGIGFVEVPIAYDGLTIVVNNDNDFVDQITVDELRQVFTVAGNAQTWAEVREGWPAKPIAIFAPGTDSGTFDYFKEVIAGEEGEIRSDISTSEDDNVLVKGVAGSPDAIGFFGVAYYEENAKELRAVPVINPETGAPVMPTPETIESGTYAPFSRPLFIYVATDSLRRPAVKRFVSFYLEQAPQLAASTGYVALPDAVYERAVDHLRGRKAGTHYVTEEGEKRTGSVIDLYTDEMLYSGE